MSVPEDGGTSTGSRSSRSWPGGGEPNVAWAPEKIDFAARVLQKSVESLTGSGSVADLQANGLLTEAELGSWDAPRVLAGAVGNAHSHITQVYADFVRELAAAVEMLRRTAARYDGTEQALTRHTRRLGATDQEPPQTPPSNPTWHNVPSAD